MQNLYKVIGSPNPFHQAGRYTFEMEEGASLFDSVVELVERSNVNPIMLRNAAISVNGELVPKEKWLETFPNKETFVVINAYPEAVFVPLLISAAGAMASGWVATLGWTTFATLAAQAAISITTSLLVMALSPGPKQNLSNSGDQSAPSARYSITGIRNSPNPYGPIPDLYGDNENYFPIVIGVYTELVGEDQFLRMLFLVGQGEVELDPTNWKIGNTSFLKYEDTRYEYREGKSTDTPHTLFPNQVREESLAIQLKQVDGYAHRTTTVGTDEIFLDVGFPNGLARVGGKNQVFVLEVQFHVQYKLTSSSTWLNAPLAFKSARGNGVKLDGDGYFTVRASSKSAIRASVGFDVTRGQYDVRIKRVTIDDQHEEFASKKYQYQTLENSYWSILRSIQKEPPIRRTGLATICICMRANEQLNGTIDQFSIRAKRRLPIYNGSTWSAPTLTRNPAWAAINIFRCTYNERALSDARLNLDQWKAFADECTLRRWTFDGAINYESTIKEVVNEICVMGRGSPDIQDGLFTVVMDNIKSGYAQKFNSRNSVFVESARILLPKSHATRVRFSNRRTFGQTDELIVYADGYNSGNATIFESLDLRWVTDAIVAYRFARVLRATAELRSNIRTISTDLEHLACTRGDLVQFSNPAVLVGLGGSRIKSVSLNGFGDATGIDLEWPLVMEAGKVYAIECRRKDNVYLTIGVVTVAGEQTSLTFSVAVPSSSPLPEAGDLIEFGEAGSVSSDMLVRTITTLPGLGRATITLIDDYAYEIYRSINHEIPEPDPNITLPPVLNRATPAPPVLHAIDSDESTLIGLNNGFLQSQILISVSVNPSNSVAIATTLQTQYRIKDSGNPWARLQDFPADQSVVSLTPVIDGETYEIEMRAVTRLGSTSEPLKIEHTVIGQTTPPPDVDNLFREGDFLYWDFPNTPLDMDGFIVSAHYGTNTNYESSTPLHAGVVTDTKFPISSLSGVRTIFVKSIDKAKNLAVNPAMLVMNLGDPLTNNLVLTQSEAPTFSGTTVNGTIVSSELTADSTTFFWADDRSLFWGTDADPFWPTSMFLEMQYTAAYSPTSDHIGATIQLLIEATGTFKVEYRQINSPAFWGVDGSTFWGADVDLFWPASLESEWTPWPGKLGPLDSADSMYEFRITFEAGLVQGVLTTLDILVDVPDIRESFKNLAIAASGTVRIPLTKTYRVIKAVNYNTENDGGTAVGGRIVDYDASLGPAMETINISGTRVAGHIGGEILGY